jgi:ADP-ribose pyrophosphatase
MLTFMRIPKKACRVFHGVIFDVYQWQQRMYDGTVSPFEALRRRNTVEVIATRGDTLFIARQRQPGKPWLHSLFGGRQEPGESPLQAAKRELLEESGMKSRHWKPLKVYIPYSKIDWKIYLYVAQDCYDFQAPHLDAGEQVRIVRVNFPRFVKVVTSRKFWGKEISYDLLKMKEEKKLVQFRKRVFGR